MVMLKSMWPRGPPQSCCRGGRDPVAPLELSTPREKYCPNVAEVLLSLVLDIETKTKHSGVSHDSMHVKLHMHAARQVDLRSLDLEASVDVRSMAAAALRRLTAADVNLLKCLLAASLYPNASPAHALPAAQFLSARMS